jgi:hypothetical protein
MTLVPLCHCPASPSPLPLPHCPLPQTNLAQIYEHYLDKEDLTEEEKDRLLAYIKDLTSNPIQDLVVGKEAIGRILPPQFMQQAVTEEWFCKSKHPAGCLDCWCVDSGAAPAQVPLMALPGWVAGCLHCWCVDQRFSSCPSADNGFARLGSRMSGLLVC